MSENRDHVVDELLEAVWTCREDGQVTVDHCLERAHAEVGMSELIAVQDMGLIIIKNHSVEFTEKGVKRAESIIRRHRLAERLMVDVLGLTSEQSEKMACEFEHAIVPEVTNGICTLLGHPKECPHGKPIPPGEDCKSGRIEVTSALRPLSQVPCSERLLRVAYLRTSDHDRLHQLLSLGFSPGVEIRVHQRTPVLVVQVEQSEFALDYEVAGDIYVWFGEENHR